MKECRTAKNGTVSHYLNRRPHREDGPAVECPDGRMEWWIHGDRHREDGPAYVDPMTGEYWFINGKRHREDGPAIQYKNGMKRWFLFDTEYTEIEFNQWLNKQKLNEKLEATLPHKAIIKRGKI